MESIYQILSYLQSTMATYLQGVIPLDHIHRRVCLCAFCRPLRACTGNGCLSVTILILQHSQFIILANDQLNAQILVL